MSDIAVEGLSELFRQLDQLPDNIQKKVARGALRAGMKVVAADAVARCPIEAPSAYAQRWGAYPGALRDSIKFDSRMVNGAAVSKLRAGSKAAFYATWVEFGTKPHLILAQRGKTLAIGGGFATRVRHPGAKPTSFMRVAIDMKVNAATQAVAAHFASRITTELEKLPDEADG